MTAKGGTRSTAKTAAQRRASKIARVAATRRANALVRAHRLAKPSSKKKKTATRGAPLGVAVQPGYWIAGDNDFDQSCVVVGIANVILAQTGQRADIAAIRGMYAANTKESMWTSTLRRVLKWPRSTPNSK